MEEKHLAKLNLRLGRDVALGRCGATTSSQRPKHTKRKNKVLRICEIKSLEEAERRVFVCAIVGGFIYDDVMCVNRIDFGSQQQR